MPKKLTTLLTVIGAVTVLVLAGNTVAYAATGGKFFLGKVNSANKASTLKRTSNGPALVVKTKRSADAPLAVNGKGRVANLNADTVDGIDSSKMVNNAYVFTHMQPTSANSFSINPKVPPGAYLVNWSLRFNGTQDASKTSQCAVTVEHGRLVTYTADSTLNNASGSLSGSGLIRVSAGDVLEWHCQSDNPFTIADNVLPYHTIHQPAQIVFTALASAKNTNAP